MNEANYIQHQFCLNKFKSNRKMLTTRTKMKVLSALNSDYMRNIGKEIENVKSVSEERVSNQEKILGEFREYEKLYIKDLKDLYQFLLHPMLRGSIICLEDVKQYVMEFILVHENLLDELSSNKESLPTSFSTILPHLAIYVKFHSNVDLELTTFEKFTQYYVEQQWDYLRHLLLAPVRQISQYERLFKGLSFSAPEDGRYRDFIKAIKETKDEIHQITFTRRNSVRMLQIQKRLCDRQPKILILGRKILKEGLLYKVNYSGKQLKPRMFFLFNDLLMCCKVIDKTFHGDEPSLLKCCAVIPLTLCCVHFIIGQPTGRGALFKVSWENYYYLLLSKEPGESQAWVKELQIAIDEYKSNTNVKHKDQPAKPLNLKRTFGIRKRNQPSVKKRAVSNQISQSSIKSVQDDSSQKENTAIRRILKWFMCVRYQ